MNGGAEPALKTGLTGVTNVRNFMFLQKTFCGSGHLGNQVLPNEE